jgi:putative endonuclease
MRQGFIYILTNKNNTTFYTGVTNNLKKRVWEHKHKVVRGFSSRYNLEKLVYFEVFDTVEQAIMREKQIKAGSRRKKVELINKINSEWKDLYETIE